MINYLLVLLTGISLGLVPALIVYMRKSAGHYRAMWRVESRHAEYMFRLWEESEAARLRLHAELQAAKTRKES